LKLDNRRGNVRLLFLLLFVLLLLLLRNWQGNSQLIKTTKSQLSADT